MPKRERKKTTIEIEEPILLMETPSDEVLPEEPIIPVPPPPQTFSVVVGRVTQADFENRLYGLGMDAATAYHVWHAYLLDGRVRIQLKRE